MRRKPAALRNIAIDLDITYVERFCRVKRIDIPFSLYILGFSWILRTIEDFHPLGEDFLYQ
jgi:hypothetical protein